MSTKLFLSAIAKFALGVALIGALLGLVISVAVVLIRQFADNTIHDKHDLQMHIDVPVLGEIPSFALHTTKSKGGRTHA